VLGHQGERPPQNIQIGAGNSGAGGELGAEVATAGGQSLGDSVLGAHLGDLTLLDVSLAGLGDAGQAVAPGRAPGSPNGRR
jgi:hypothetical protein